MTAPLLSIVIASGAGGEFLFRCLASLERQAADSGAEILVVDRVGPVTRDRVAREYPGVRLLTPETGHRLTVPEMRRHGAEAARAPIVAVLEEHCVAPPEWVQAILGSFRSGDAAIGGPILDADFPRVRDWVVYFSEYHGFVPPWLDGDRLGLNGANIAYSRALLLAEREALDLGYWEVVLHPRLVRHGRFRAVSAMGVYHTGPFDYGYYLRQRYLLSRVWGGSQRTRTSAIARLAHVALFPVVPVLMLARIASVASRRRRLASRFLLALPLLIPAMVALAWGECLGYLVGPGRALEEVE